VSSDALHDALIELAQRLPPKDAAVVEESAKRLLRDASRMALLRATIGKAEQ
jgi:hypothetical protein